MSFKTSTDQPLNHKKMHSVTKTTLKTLIFAASFLGMASHGIAEAIVMPHTFEAGKKAMASEVNDNFTALMNANNNNDARISELEKQVSLANVEQMICESSYLAVRQSEEITCQSESGATKYTSLNDIFNEGWKMVSVGGTGDANRALFLFHR